MIERIWSGKSSLYLLLLPLSLLYGLVSTLLRLSYQRGWRQSWRSPIPVVVVGNLSVGGNGKTPMVLWLIEALRQHGLRPGVVSRGYGGKSSRYPLLLDDSTRTYEAGDEPVLIYQRTHVPVVVSPVRRAAVQALLAQGDVDIVITDDGLQHYALARDVEIVVIDGKRRFGNGWWLPAGPMRERAARLNRVHAVIVNGGQARENEIPMMLTPGQAVNITSGERLPVHLLSQVVAMAGIGYPPRFFATLQEQGVSPVKEIAFADHQQYSSSQLEALAAPSQSLLMTEKDAVKVRAYARENWWYLPVNATLPEPQASALIQSILQCCQLQSENHMRCER